MARAIGRVPGDLVFRRVSTLLLMSLGGCVAPQVDPDDPTDETSEETDVVDTDTDSDAETDTDTVDETDIVGADGVVISLGEPVVCADPSARTTYGPWITRYAQRERITDGLFRLVGGGLLAVDLTGDDRLDLLLPGRGSTQFFVQSVAGGFTDEAAQRLPVVDLTWATAVSSADVDGDGDVDVFITRWTLPNVLLLNDGTGHFTDGTRASGITGAWRSQTSSWGDMDVDGDLDLFVGNYGPHPDDAFAVESFNVADPSQLWENQGDGTFVERSEQIPQDLHDAYTFSSVWIDVDGDLRQDLLVINDFGWARPNRILWNRPGGLEEDDGTAQFDIPFAGMGLGIGDLNHDGVPDFVQSSWKALSLLQSYNGRPVWFESAEARALVPDWKGPGVQIFGWGSEVVDLDLDGDDDVLMNFGYWDEHSKRDNQADAVFEQGTDGTFTDEAVAWGLAHRGASRGLVVADLNADGWPDVVKRVLDDSSPMHLSRCGEGSWLRVSARDAAPNTHAIGAVVKVHAGETTWTRWILGGGTGMFGAGPPEALVGLGGLDAVDDIELRWPDGQVTHTGPVGSRRHVRFTRP